MCLRTMLELYSHLAIGNAWVLRVGPEVVISDSFAGY